jgi:hypothetical protein
MKKPRVWYIAVVIVVILALFRPPFRKHNLFAQDARSKKPNASVNAADFGAKGDGVTDDSPAIQAAVDAVESHHGGSIFVPAGTYFMDRTVLIGDHVELFGAGLSTIFRRGDSPTPVPEYRDCDSTRPPTSRHRQVFHNRNYNCANVGIHLHDFAIDGSALTSVPNSVMIAFSGIKGTVIERIHIRDAPQDAIFLKNGGVGTIVQNVTIIGHDRLWGNGSGINVEMHKEGNNQGRPILRDNTIITTSPNFCTANLAAPCSHAAECSRFSPNTCGLGASTSAAIGLTWVDGPHPASALIQGNTILVANGHYGIFCNGCVDAEITGNNIKAAEPAGDSARGVTRVFTGILANSPPGRFARNLQVTKNTVEGSGDPDDGCAILMSGDPEGWSQTLTISGNTIQHKNVDPKHAAVEVRGWTGFHIDSNVFSNVNGVPLVLGSLGWTTRVGSMAQNDFSSLDLTEARAIQVRSATELKVSGNKYRQGK